MKTKALTILIMLFAGFATASAATAVAVPDSLTIFTGDQVPRVYLRNSEGTFTDSEMVTMSPYGDTGGYVAYHVNVENGGFRFYAADTQLDTPTQDAPMKWYVSSSQGVQPPLEMYLNPLAELGSSDSEYIAIDSGVYDIYYFDQETTQQHCHLYTYVSAVDTDEDVFPSDLYLLSPSGGVITLPEQSDGVYAGFVTLPEGGFKVSYQNYGYNIPAYIFGPESASTAHISSGRVRNLVYGQNTYMAITYTATVAADKVLKPGDRAYVKVDLYDDTNTIEVISDKFTGLPDVDEGVSIIAVHDLDGIAVPPCGLTCGGLKEGVYIVTYSDGTTAKYLVQ